MASKAVTMLCEMCAGQGAYPLHAPGCRDDLCAMNGDYYSCNGSWHECEVCEGTGIVLLADLVEAERTADLVEGVGDGGD